MVQDFKPKDRADYIYCIRAIGHQENKICPSKASEVYRPVWCSIVDHLVATLHHLPKGFLVCMGVASLSKY